MGGGGGAPDAPVGPGDIDEDNCLAFPIDAILMKRCLASPVDAILLDLGVGTGIDFIAGGEGRPPPPRLLTAGGGKGFAGMFAPAVDRLMECRVGAECSTLP